MFSLIGAMSSIPAFVCVVLSLFQHERRKWLPAITRFSQFSEELKKVIIFL